MNANKAVESILQGNITEFQQYVAALPYQPMCDYLCTILELPQMDQQYANTQEYRIIREALTPFYGIMRSINQYDATDQAETTHQNQLRATPYINDLLLLDCNFEVYHIHTSGFSAKRSRLSTSKPEVFLHVNYGKKYKAQLMFERAGTTKIHEANNTAALRLLLEKF